MKLRKDTNASIHGRFARSLAVTGLGLVLLAPVQGLRAEADIRRDAVVEAVQDVMPSVVNVRTESYVEASDPFEAFRQQFYGPQVQPCLGSGVIISEDGYLLTNLHVVNRARRIQVKLSDEAGGEVYEVQRFLAKRNTDVALLKIIPKKPGEKFHAIKFADDDDLLLGETVLALGNPFGLGGSVSRGILSSKSRATPKENETLGMENWLQTDASINPGNSGGPLTNLRGELIGINVAILQGAQGIGFAIPIKEVRAALSEMLVPETASRWFGAHLRWTTPLVVDSVDAGSPAAKAGLQAGDLILQVNGRTPHGFLEFNRWLRDGSKFTFALAIKHGAEQRNMNVRLTPFSELFKQRLGADVQEVTPELASQLGLKTDSGLLVSRVEKGGPADKAALREYYLVSGIDGYRVDNYLDAFHVLANKKKDDPVELLVEIPKTRDDLILGYQQGVTTLKLR